MAKKTSKSYLDKEVDTISIVVLLVFSLFSGLVGYFLGQATVFAK